MICVAVGFVILAALALAVELATPCGDNCPGMLPYRDSAGKLVRGCDHTPGVLAMRAWWRAAR